MEDLQAAVGTAQLQVLGIAVRSRHNRAVLLPHGLYSRLTRLIQVRCSSMIRPAKECSETFKCLCCGPIQIGQRLTT